METLNFDMEGIAADTGAVKDALGGLPAVADRAAKSLGSLDNKLLVLRFNLGKLRAALERAFAPIAATVVPVVNTALRGITAVVNDAAKVIAALFGTVQEEAVTTTRVTGSAVKRSVASFDQLERLNGASGGGAVETVKLPKAQDPLTPQLQAVVDKIRAVMAKIRSLLQPLKEIDFTSAMRAFSALGQGIVTLGSSAVKGLEWAWHNLLVPLAQWTIEAAVPAAVQLLAQGFSALSAILTPLGAGFRELLTALSPVAEFLGQAVVKILNGLTTLLGSLGETFTREGGRIQSIFSGLGTALSQLWALASPVLTQLGALWDLTIDSLAAATDSGISTVVGVLEGLAQFVAGVFTADWQRAWQGLTGAVSNLWAGLQQGLKSPINGIISFLNQLLTGITTGINTLVQGLNTLHFSVPSWVPLLGGKSFGFSLSAVKTPQIPYLAQGAVLPANKPFLAVVGDQKSGTNIEAPLSTIQEAVAAVMDSQIDAMLAGFEALLEENRQLRYAVESIEVGDTVIGQAAARYDRRRALARGGVL